MTGGLIAFSLFCLHSSTHNYDKRMSSTVNHEPNKRVKVAVVGAGAAGLMCTCELLKQGVVQQDEIIVLEARDYVGGRIHTTTESVTSVSPNKDDSLVANADPPHSTIIYRDHGAAWVHGTGFVWPNFHLPDEQKEPADNNNEEEEEKRVNPMMELLAQITPVGEKVCLTHLEPTSKYGNPWMHPGHTLIEPKKLVVFVNGTQVGGSTTFDSTSGKMAAAETSKQSQDEVIFKDALKIHNEIMQQVGKIGYDLIVNGKAIEAVQQSFQDALNNVLPNGNAGNEDMVTQVSGFYRHLIECWHATSATGLQLHEFSANVGDQDDGGDLAETDEQYTDEGDFVGPHCTMKQGMQTVLKPLIDVVGPCIRLNEPVSSIRQRQTADGNENDIGHVFLETSLGSVIEADYCVVTIPLGCLAEGLKSATDTERNNNNSSAASGIMFQPSLSDAKILAIQHMNMGAYKKVFLTFDRIFWPSQEFFLGLIRHGGNKETDNGIGNYMLLDNLWACKHIPCIEAVLVGNAGKWATGKSDGDVKDAVLAFLASSMGLDLDTQLQRWCIDCHITRWEEDPYSRGAYSGYKLGTTEEHTIGLATPEWGGRLEFAGEATLSGDEGSVHAALISGRISASRIEASLHGTSSG